MEQFRCDGCGKTVIGTPHGGMSTKSGVKVTCSTDCWMKLVLERDAAGDLTTLGKLEVAHNRSLS